MLELVYGITHFLVFVNSLAQCQDICQSLRITALVFKATKNNSTLLKATCRKIVMCLQVLFLDALQALCFWTRWAYKDGFSYETCCASAPGNKCQIITQQITLENHHVYQQDSVYIYRLANLPNWVVFDIHFCQNLFGKVSFTVV